MWFEVPDTKQNMFTILRKTIRINFETNLKKLYTLEEV